MGIKRTKLRSLFKAITPINFRLKLLDVMVAKKGFNRELITQELIWDDDDIVEFWLTGFNNKGLKYAFYHLYNIYDKILYKDPQWHYFYEGTYSLIRCSLKFKQEVKEYLDENDIFYKWPITNWRESTYMTIKYQEIYKELFHNFSILIIEMFRNGDKSNIYRAADRIIHPFLNHACYLAEINGNFQNQYLTDTWESSMMASLTAGRAFYAGTIRGESNGIKKGREQVINYLEKKLGENNE